MPINPAPRKLAYKIYSFYYKVFHLEYTDPKVYQKGQREGRSNTAGF